MKNSIFTSPEQYREFVVNTFTLIMNEINQTVTNHPNFLPSAYPKFIHMYQYFRMLRGEAFSDTRPSAPLFQREFYAMENELQIKVDEVRSHLDVSDESTRRNIEDAKKKFNIS